MTSAHTVRFAAPRHLHGVEVASTRSRSAFPVHSHPEYVVGVVTGGVEELRVGAVRHMASPGSLLLLNPGEPHANASIGGAPLDYRTFYIATDALDGWLEDASPPAFEAPVARRPRLGRVLARAHEVLAGDNDRMEQESAFAAVVSAMLALDSGRRRPDSCDQRVGAVRRHIETHFASSLALSELAAMANLSVFHLLRLFRGEVGMTPVAYRNHCRVQAARAMLRRGRPLAEAALAAGFADQSHMTRHFRRVFGLPPGRYRQQ